jgi:divalent metal cation (Fe/Co/Zn/Cd) transporter
MKPVKRLEFPPEQEAAFRKARRLEWISIVYVSSAAVFLFLVMGNSQAMRTSWLEDMMSLVPPIAFLVSSRLARRAATNNFPYGMHASVSVGYLTASLALFAMGAFLLVEAVIKLVALERTTIGGFDIFGTTIWAGWPMLAALAYTGIPTFFLGRAKLKLAPQIHDKVLYADAEMNRADWMAVVATAAGVIGTGLGFWWADATAAGLVSIDILRDGLVNLRAAVTDLIDEQPKRTADSKKHDPLPDELARYIESFDWVEKAEVRMREEGHVFFGEAFVVPKRTKNLTENIAELAEKSKGFNWRVHDMTIMPVSRTAFERDEADRQ